MKLDFAIPRGPIALCAVVASHALACSGSAHPPGSEVVADSTSGGDSATLPTTTTDAGLDADAAYVCNPDAIAAWDGAPTACLIRAPASAAEAGADAVGDANDASIESGATDAADATVPDSVADASTPEAGDPRTYPAFALDAPRIVSLGGPVLTRPEVVTITWEGEDDAIQLEQFTDRLGVSELWNRVTCEYGISPAVSGCSRHVHMKKALPSIFRERDLDNFVRSNASDPVTSGWPAPNANTVYLVILPVAVSLQIFAGARTDDACALGYGGYHTSTSLKGGTTAAYAVIPRCDFGAGLTDTSTWAISHELAEAATDPVPSVTAPAGTSAYSGFDDDHAAWTLFQIGHTEVGDACEYYADAGYDDPVLGARVQRTWSNWSIAGGHSPCVPAQSAPYFSATPLDLVPVTFSMPSFVNTPFGGTAKGINIPVGSTGAFHVGYYSDAPMAVDWSLRAVEGNGLPGTSLTGGYGAAYDNHNLDIHIDKPSGHNGDVATVTVKVNGTDPLLGANLVTLISSQGSTNHYWPVLVTSN